MQRTSSVLSPATRERGQRRVRFNDAGDAGDGLDGGPGNQMDDYNPPPSPTPQRPLQMNNDEIRPLQGGSATANSGTPVPTFRLCKGCRTQRHPDLLDVWTDI